MILAFMIAVSSLSMWMSNTATTLMMLPVALAIVEKSKSNKLAVPLLLGIGFAANIGGIGTPIGTPPNIVFSEVYKEYAGVEFGFFNWMMIGIPVIICFLPIIWLWLTRNVKGKTDFDMEELGPWRKEEWRSLTVFITVVFLWVTRGTPFGGWSHWFSDMTWLINIFPSLESSRETLASFVDLSGAHNGHIALLGVVVMFLIPNGKKNKNGDRLKLLDWATAVKIPWGIVLLMGGGFTIAMAFKVNGVTSDIGSILNSFTTYPSWMLIAGICLIVTFLTNMTSNTATTTLMLPILVAMALSGNIELGLVMIPATISASCAFLLPIGTPTNLMIYATEKISIKVMMREGILLTFIAVVIITVLCLIIL